MPDRSVRRVNWVNLTALALAAAALALAVWTFVTSPSRQSASEFTDAQRSDAKTAVCGAFDTVRTGVATNTNVTPPGGPEDIAGAMGAAANARIALSDGGQYLLARLDPATPEDLAVLVRRFADQLLDIGAAATAGVPNTDAQQADRLEDAVTTSAEISDLCR